MRRAPRSGFRSATGKQSADCPEQSVRLSDGSSNRMPEYSRPKSTGKLEIRKYLLTFALSEEF